MSPRPDLLCPGGGGGGGPAVMMQGLLQAKQQRSWDPRHPSANRLCVANPGPWPRPHWPAPVASGPEEDLEALRALLATQGWWAGGDQARPEYRWEQCRLHPPPGTRAALAAHLGGWCWAWGAGPSHSSLHGPSSLCPVSPQALCTPLSACLSSSQPGPTGGTVRNRPRALAAPRAAGLLLLAAAPSSSLSASLHPPQGSTAQPAPLALSRGWRRSHLAAGPSQQLTGRGGQASWSQAGSGQLTSGGFILLCWGGGGGCPRSTLSDKGRGGADSKCPAAARPHPPLPLSSFCFWKTEPARGQGPHFPTVARSQPGRGEAQAPISKRPRLHHSFAHLGSKTKRLKVPRR